MQRKISVIGAGKTGATTAQRLAERNYADIVLFDVVEGLAEGEALDLLESGPILGFDSKVTGVTVKDGQGYEQLAGSLVVLMTAGIARKPGMSRDDLVKTNQKIMHSWAEAIKEHAARIHFDCAFKPGGCDYPIRRARNTIPARTHHRTGRHSGQCPFSHIHR